jgi:hypothetical protein
LGGLANEDELQKTTEPLFFKHPVVESFIFVICTSMSFKELLICVIGFQVLNYFCSFRFKLGPVMQHF